MRSERHKMVFEKHGSILLMVLVLITIVSYVLTKFVERANVEIQGEGYYVERSRLRLHAWSYLEIAVAVLADVKAIDNAIYAPAQGCGRNTLLQIGRWLGSAAFVAPRICLLRGHVSFRCANDAGAIADRHWRAGYARHALRRPPDSRTRRGRMQGEFILCALWSLSDACRPPRNRPSANLYQLRD